MNQFKNVAEVWSAIDAGKTVHWSSEAYALTIEETNPEWRARNGFAIPFSDRNDKCLRVTCTENYFGSLLTEDQLPELFTV